MKKIPQVKFSSRRLCIGYHISAIISESIDCDTLMSLLSNSLLEKKYCAVSLICTIKIMTCRQDIDLKKKIITEKKLSHVSILR